MNLKEFFSKRALELIIAVIFGIFGLIWGIAEREVGYPFAQNLAIALILTFILFIIGYVLGLLVKLLYRTDIGKVITGLVISVLAFVVSYILSIFLLLGLTGGWIVLAGESLIVKIMMLVILSIIYISANTFLLKIINNDKIKIGIKIGYIFIIIYILFLMF
ncbi:MAG: hypothetical protein AABW80_03575 [Nanoarchaeota archaeon]